MINKGFKTIRCDMLHENGCKHTVKGRLIKEFEREMLEHDRKVHPVEFYKMNEMDKRNLHEIISILILS